ncbi:MAG: hypothetical protein F083_906 [bacterium F083]|nr:MAG: hypothetical protein F083_906 [bacterium F083]
MLGAIIGDTIGSVYEFNNIKTTNFPLFTNESMPKPFMEVFQRLLRIM